MGLNFDINVKHFRVESFDHWLSNSTGAKLTNFEYWIIKISKMGLALDFQNFPLAKMSNFEKLDRNHQLFSSILVFQIDCFRNRI